MFITSPKISEVIIARQPIYDENLKTFAYELLFRDMETESAGDEDDGCASLPVIINAIMELGQDRLVGHLPAFIKVGHDVNLEKLSVPFDRQKFFLEISGHGQSEAALMKRIEELQDQGFNLVLKSVDVEARLMPLLDRFQMVKIDITRVERESLPLLVHKFSSLGMKLVAEKVESEEDFDYCRNIGFSYFQGYLFSRPKMAKHITLPANNLLLLQILAKAQDPAVEFGELEELISRDVGISFKLLRMINSARFSLTKKVDSLRQALVLLGLQEIKNWLAFIALSKLDAVPQELTTMSMTRARMCKLLAEKMDCHEADVYFSMGLFSLLDIMMRKPMESLLKALPFSDEFNTALLTHKGSMGEALDCAIACEQGDWSQIAFKQLSQAEINELYLQALGWSQELGQDLD